MTTNERTPTDQSTERTTPFDAHWDWQGGAVAGAIATVAMGIAISATQLATLQVAIAGLYGQSGNLLAGWIAHLLHGTLFGTLFTLLLADPGLYRLADWHWKTVVAGAVYGVVLAVAGAGIVMPIWLGLAGFPVPPSVPNVTVPMLAWHLLYGVTLGGVYPLVERV